MVLGGHYPVSRLSNRKKEDCLYIKKKKKKNSLFLIVQPLTKRTNSTMEINPRSCIECRFLDSTNFEMDEFSILNPCEIFKH